MAQAIRKKIILHEILPGTPLRELDLAVEYGVSRTQIRQALFALSKHGLIDREPNRGAIVRRIDLVELLQLYEIREVLEATAVKAATERAPRKAWSDLSSLFGPKTRAAVLAGDFAPYFGDYQLFRSRIAAAANNPPLMEIVEDLYDRTKIWMRRVALISNRAELALEEHRRTLAAVRAGDAEKAALLRRTNIANGKAWLERYYEHLS